MEKIGKEIKDFEDMVPFKVNVLRGIYSYGFENPSLIQKKAIPIFSNNKKRVDLIAQSECGTGKTASYIISMMNNLDDDRSDLQGIIIVPTRELANQISLIFLHIGEYTKFKIHVSVDVSSLQMMKKEREIFRRTRPQIVIGTTERLKLEISEGHMDVSQVKMLVLDECDCLLNDQQKPQTIDLFQYLPNNKGMQIGIFSSTISDTIVQSAEKFMNNPYKILLDRIPQNLTVFENHYSGIETIENYGILPVGVLTNIFLFLDLETVSISCSSTCKLFHRIIQSQNFWKEYYFDLKNKKKKMKMISNHKTSEKEKEKEIKPFNWKEQYFIETHPHSIRPPLNIECYSINVLPTEKKIDVLLQLLGGNIHILQVIIFFETIERVDLSFYKLTIDENYKSILKISGGNSEENDSVLKKFRTGDARILLVPCGFGRGLDFHRVSMVINYDIPRINSCPKDEEGGGGGGDTSDHKFLRRAGLCGRYGRKGVCVTLVNGEKEKEIKVKWEKKHLKRIIECNTVEEFEKNYTL